MGNKATKTLKHISPVSRGHLGVFILIFAAIGGIIIWKSFAAPNPSLPGDLNNDNTVNVTDMSILLSNYGTSNSTADINSDGTVNVLDLSILLSHYGQSISSFSTNLTANMTINTPFTWTFDPGVTTTAGYFYADGVQLTKVTSPGPYSFNLTTTTLTAGTHTLGGSWDLSDGTHVTFPQTYSVTINNGSGGTSSGPGSGYSGPWRDTSYTIPTTFTKTITTASAFSGLVSASGTLTVGDVVHVVGPLTINGCPGCTTYVLKKLAAPGASIYFDSNVVFAGDSNTTIGYPGVVMDASNISFYGGAISGGQGSAGMKVGPQLSADTQTVTNIKWWGLKISNTGSDGIYVGGEKNSSGTWLGASGIDVDAEIYDVCHQTQNDAHYLSGGIAGTGMHAIYIGGSPSDPPGTVMVDNSKFSIYAHDISKCVGDAQVGQSTQNTEIWLRANNLSFTYGTTGWASARAFTPWTGNSSPYTDKNITVHDVEAHNITGPVVFTESLGSGPVTVEYGRGVNVLTWSVANSYFGGKAYQANSNITYQDVLP